MSSRLVPVDMANLGAWIAAAKTATLPTALQRNTFVATLGAGLDVLARPDVVLPADPTGLLNLPRVPVRTRDPAVREATMLGGMPLPDWWSRTGAGTAPTSLPAWMQSTNVMRWTLYGALRALLDDLTRTGEVAEVGVTNPRGTQGITAQDVALVLLPGPVFGAAFAMGESRGETERTRIREDANVTRYAESCANTLKLYQERLQVFRATGTMPPASAGEQAANPIVDTRPAAGSPSQRGESWWGDNMKSLAVGGVAGASLLTAAAGGTYLYRRAQSSAAAAARAAVTG